VPHVQFWESNKLPDSAKAVLVDLAIALVHTFTRQPNGTTDIDVAVIRDGKNLKGRVLGFVLGTIGRRVLEKAFENSVKALEARNGAAREVGASTVTFAVPDTASHSH